MKKTCLSYPGNKVSGVVLVVALIFLVALTAVTSLLMQNSTLDMKMSGANEDKTIAVQQVISEVDEIMYNQIRKDGNIKGSNGFSLSMASYPLEVKNEGDVEAHIVINGDHTKIEGNCPRTGGGYSDDVIQCNFTRLDVTLKYGRNNSSVLSASAGVSQQVPK